MRLIILIALCVLHNLSGQNSQPVMRPDTFTGSNINVLKNDYDSNKDSFRVYRFCGQLVNRNAQITKKDTGVFSINYKGEFSATFSDSFYGMVTLTYQAKDYKSGTPRTAVKILAINNVDLHCPYHIRKEGGKIFVFTECTRVYGMLHIAVIDGMTHYWVKYYGPSPGIIELTKEQYDHLSK